MPSSFTPLLKLELPATGELSGTWGTTVNNAITTPLSEAVAGTTTITVGGSDYTLSNGDGSAANEARKMFIVATGTPGASRNVICPAASKFYVFRNDTNQTLTLKTLSGTGIAVPAGQYRFLYCNGTDVVETFNAMASLTLGTALAAASGGTGQSSYTAGDLLYATGTTALSKLGIGAANRVLTSSGSAPQWVTSLTGLTGVSSSSITNTSLTATRLVYSTTGGAQTDSANLTFDGTSLTLGGNPTLSAGTANGVLYLNASKVATSGSALTFDGIDFKVGGTAGTTPSLTKGVYLESSANNAVIGYSLYVNEGSNNRRGSMFLDDVNGLWGWDVTATSGVPDYVWRIAGAEQMRLDSTGLGIGTSSPGAKLDVNGASYLGGNIQTISGSTLYNSTGDLYVRAGTSGALRLGSGGSNDRMVLDSSGNLGIGTSSPNQKLDVAGSVQIRSSGTQYLNNSDNTNQYYWQNIGSSGANNATLILSRTNAGETLRVDSSGNLGIGTTSPVTKLDVVGTIRASSSITAGYAVGFDQTYIASNGATGNGCVMATVNYANNAYQPFTQDASVLIWRPSGTEGMRLTSTGLGIGTSSPAVKLEVSGSAAVARVSGTSATVPQLQLSSAGVVAWSLRANNDGGSDFTIYQDATQRLKIDSSGNLGIGTSSPVKRLDVRISTPGEAALALLNNDSTAAGTNVSSIEFASNGVAKASIAAAVYGDGWMSFRNNNNTEKMRLDASGNLGIGTTSPGARLDVQAPEGRVILTSTTGTNASYYTAVNTGGSFFIGRDNSSGGLSGTAYSAALISTGAYPMVFGTNSAEQMRLDSSGNLGLGVTPSAWSQGRAIELLAPGMGLWNGSGSPSSIYMTGNAYFNGGFKYGVNGEASHYYQYLGQHVWSTAPSGTAGNAISFTQAMTLDASGRLLLGTTSGSNKLEVASAGSVTAAIRATSAGTSASPYSLKLSFVGVDGGGVTAQEKAYVSAIDQTFNDQSSYLAFGTNNAGTVAERARIPAAGGMVVGTAALATTATDGFLYVPTCAGTPTGTPTTQTGTAPIVVDTTNNKLYFYSGGQWRDAGP